MAEKIFVNMSVKDLDKSIKFFTKLGYKFESDYTDKTATCLILGKNIFVMLLTEEKFKTFVKKKIVNAKDSTESIMGLSAESKKEVNEIFDRAIKAGATKANETYDYGWMYGKSFYDLDGHMWEFFFMDEKARPKN